MARYSPQKAFSVMELLIVLMLAGVLSVLAINTVLRSPTSPNKWGRVANDYVAHLEAACNTVRLAQGNGPLNARKVVTVAPVDPSKHQYEYMYTATATEDPEGYQSAAYTTQCALHDASTTDTDRIPKTYVCNNAARGLSQFLPTWESHAKSYSNPDRLEYPNGLVLYLKPDQATVPGHAGVPVDGEDSTPASFSHDDIMNNVDDREFVLLDMNGSALPNSIGPGGDQVLLHVDDDSCKVLTARQKCKLVNTAGTCNDTSVTTYQQSFLDEHKNYCNSWVDTACPYSTTP